MARISRWAILLTIIAIAPGCGRVNRPYLNDPLFRTSSPVRGDPTRTQSRELPLMPEPVPPRPPMEAPAYLPELVEEEPRPLAIERACYFPSMGVYTTVPLSWPVSTALPPLVKAMQ